MSTGKQQTKHFLITDYQLYQLIMQEAISRYQFDKQKHIGTSYADAEIKNYSYKATRITDDLPVHLVFYSSNKQGQIASYTKKMHKLAEIKHPNITPIIQYFSDIESNQLILILEWTEGFCLGECLGKDITLDWKSATSLIKDIVLGLDEIHKAGLVHSFVNIENIQLHQGKARLSFRHLIYKTYYLAPEIKQNHQKCRETDLFSLGVCYYKCLFGSLPFKQKSHEDYIKNVKAGIPRKLPIPECNFPKVIYENIQSVLNLLCHYHPIERLKGRAELQKLYKKRQEYDNTLVTAALGENYQLLTVNESNQEEMKLSVVNFKQKRFYSMDIISHNLTQLSSYIEDVVQPFRGSGNSSFANVKDFYAPLNDSLAIIYDHCSQGSLRQYQDIRKFDNLMVQEVGVFLRKVLNLWTGQYRFLTNDQILIKKGKPVLKFPPFPTKSLKDKHKQSKKGNYFIAPEVFSGIQSQTADSWSVGVMEYWMRFNSMPNFDNNNKLLLNQKSQLTPEQIKEFNAIIEKKHVERKNLFPLENKKNQIRRISLDSLSSTQSPRLQSPIKFSRPQRAGTMGTMEVNALNQIDIEDELQLVDMADSNMGSKVHHSQRPHRNKRGKTIQSNIQTDSVRNQLTKTVTGNPSQKQQFAEQIQQDDESVGQKEGRRKEMQNKQNEGKLQSSKNKHLKSQKQLLGQSFNKLTTMHDQLDVTYKDPVIIKKQNRFSIFDSAAKPPTSRRDSKKTANKDGKVKNNREKRDTQATLTIEPTDMTSKIFNSIAEEAWKLSLVEKHWTKPIRIILKGVIAFIIFMVTAGGLLKSRYDYITETVFLLSDTSATTPTINFTLVTRTPLQTYLSLNNQTLSYVRDNIQCVTYDYNMGSNVLGIISGGSFSNYQAFGFIIILFNLILIFLVLSRLDMPKALSLIKFDQHLYAPLYSWILIGLAQASLISCTYLAYGGLFSLKLDPCISRPAFPSLMFLLKNMTSSFIWRFIWIYIGIIIAYVLIIYLIVKPAAGMPRYLYISLFMLYLAGVGARGLGTYNLSIQSVIGACGEFLCFLVGLPLVAIDLIFSCRLRTVEKSNRKGSSKDPEQKDVNLTQNDFTQKN